MNPRAPVLHPFGNNGNWRSCCKASRPWCPVRNLVVKGVHGWNVPRASDLVFGPRNEAANIRGNFGHLVADWFACHVRSSMNCDSYFLIRP